MFATEMFGRPRTKKEATLAVSLHLGIELSLFLGAAFRAVFSIKLILLGFCSEFAIKVFGRFPSADLKKTLMVFSWLIAKKSLGC